MPREKLGYLGNKPRLFAAERRGDRRHAGPNDQPLSAMFRPFLLLALRRPGLWPALLSAAWAFRTRRWYRKPPFLPLPSREYMRWRLETAYGNPEAVPPEEEIVRFLTWSAEMRKRMR